MIGNSFDSWTEQSKAERFLAVALVVAVTGALSLFLYLVICLWGLP